MSVNTQSLIEAGSWCLIFAGILGIFQSYQKKSRKGLDYIKNRAKADNRVFALSPRKQLREDKWKAVAYNTWGVFAQTDDDSIVIFDLLGNPLAELCSPNTFVKFSADEESICFVQSSGIEASYAFSEIQVFYKENAFFVPPVRQPVSIRAVKCNENQLRVQYQDKHLKVFHYYSIFPNWVYRYTKIAYFLLWIVIFVLYTARLFC